MIISFEWPLNVDDIYILIVSAKNVKTYLSFFYLCDAILYGRKGVVNNPHLVQCMCVVSRSFSNNYM